LPVAAWRSGQPGALPTGVAPAHHGHPGLLPRCGAGLHRPAPLSDLLAGRTSPGPTSGSGPGSEFSGSLGAAPVSGGGGGCVSRKRLPGRSRRSPADASAAAIRACGTAGVWCPRWPGGDGVPTPAAALWLFPELPALALIGHARQAGAGVEQPGSHGSGISRPSDRRGHWPGAIPTAAAPSPPPPPADRPALRRPGPAAPPVVFAHIGIAAAHRFSWLATQIGAR
jgi:hypothetical protein